MWAQILEYLGVAGICALKFLPGMATAIALQYGFLEQVLVTGIGGIFGTTFFAFFGDAVKRRIRSFRNRKKPPQAVKPPPNPDAKPTLVRRVWNRFGLFGVALLTPPLLSPPVGVGVAIGFGAPRKKVIVYMAVSMAVWAVIFAALGTSILAFFVKIGLMSPR